MNYHRTVSINIGSYSFTSNIFREVWFNYTRCCIIYGSIFISVSHYVRHLCFNYSKTINDTTVVNILNDLSRVKIKLNFNNVKNWFIRNDSSLNAEKTKCVIFHTKRSTINLPGGIILDSVYVPVENIMWTVFLNEKFSLTH